MNVRVLTLRYDESLGGFPEEPLRQAMASGNILETREHFFIHGGVPHLTLLLVMDAGAGGTLNARRHARDGADPGDTLPDHLKPLYRSLRQWRNDRAKQDQVPAYVIMRNVQVAEICRALPRTLEALRAIDGVGEGTVGKYGKDILAQIPPDLKPGPQSGKADKPVENATEEEPTK
jgi:superfamily II DNA helicase RecQ